MTSVESQATAAAPAVKQKRAESYSIGPRMFVGTAVMGLLVLGCGSWAAFAKLSGAVIAPGSVVVERHVKKVQHKDGGIVAEILVREGSHVEAGTILVKLDDTQTRSELGIIRSQLTELTGRKSRLIAERDGLDDIPFPDDFDAMGPEVASVRRGETRLFSESKKTVQSQKEQLGLRIEQLQEEINGLTRQRTAKSSELELIDKELSQIRKLHERKLTPISRVFAMEREATRLGGELGSIISQIARAKGQISELNLQILNIDQTLRTEAQRELRAIEGKLAELVERRGAASDRLLRMHLKAPQSGLVHELAVHTIGGVITPAEPVMLIVPENEERTIEVRLAPFDIDQVTPGQMARLRFSAFNQRTTPETEGQVTHVAADVTVDPQTGQSYYMARIAIDSAARKQLGDLKLLPGMPVEVFISTGERTALSYFVKPFTDQFARAFREE
ncbi:MAG: HlyD family type I secretion periplasmic adaptor subunit [Alphaproteobacteria bacterium]|nr:HlyD family type I secretion periplasmic adaptor subunit [Alphaproteobacteria bacterium]